MAGCQGASANAPPVFVPTPSPSPTPAPQHLYVGGNNAPASILQFTLPVTATSTPNFAIAAGNYVVTVAVDVSGNLAAGDSAGNLKFFAAPLSGASTPAAAFKNGPAATDWQNVFAATGELFAATGGNAVNRFTPPFANASTPSATIANPALTSAIGTAFDAAQNLYISNVGPTGSNIFVYAPPYTGVPIVTPIQPGILGMGPSAAFYRHLAVSATQLFVSSASGSGRVDVYALPITAASAPAFAITNSMAGPEGLALDAAGNLYVANFNAYTIRVYAPPFSASSAPTVTLTLVGGIVPYGIAVGR
ncbi:MAG: hypothetical protein QOF71_1268 [Candidatus Eremiobacteraeota bacterium]|nr:hypothetical protein [Candidatus Eremiobacteraeota bacterium]